VPTGLVGARALGRRVEAGHKFLEAAVNFDATEPLGPAGMAMRHSLHARFGLNVQYLTFGEREGPNHWRGRRDCHRNPFPSCLQSRFFTDAFGQIA